MKRNLAILLCIVTVGCGNPPTKVVSAPSAEKPKQMCDLKVDYGTCLDKLEVGVPINCTPTVTLLNPPVPCEQLGIMGAQSKK